MQRTFSRRELLRGATIAATASILAACQPKVVEKVVTKEVEKVVTKEVEKVVKETVVVQGTPQVVEKVITVVPETKCAMDWKPTEPPAPKKYSPPVKISVPICDNDPEWIGKDSRTNNPAYNRIKNYLGIEYQVHWQATGDVCEQKYKTDMAAGTLPDMFLRTGVALAEMIDNGAVEEIRSIWEATASPLTKEKKEYPNGRIWRPVWRGEKLYGVAWVNGPAYNVDNIGFIRKDWLDKLGLPMPETLDDITRTAREFLKAKVCEYPILTRAQLITYAMSLDAVWGAFGAMPELWLKTADGKLEYGSLRPGAKDAIGVIRQWYQEKLIYPDFYTITNPNATAQISGGKGGIFFDPWWVGGSLVDWEQQLPGAQFAIMPLPKGPTGLRGRRGPSDAGNATVFRKGVDPIKIEAAINELNWNIERHVNWEKYQQYGEWRNSHVFAEGYEWVWDDKCELTAGPVKNVEGTYKYTHRWTMSFPFMCYPSYQADIFRDMAKWQKMDYAKLNKAQRYLLGRAQTRREMELYLYVVDTLDQRYTEEWEGTPTKNMIKLLPDLNKLELEYRIAMVIGNKPLSAFEEFVAAWKKNGGDQVTAEVNEWYAAQKK
jgi:putative aldouronate transport system substrate-binding protein